MSKKKAKKPQFVAEPALSSVGPETRQLMRKFGLTEEEALRMIRECDAALYGSSSAHARQDS